MKRIITCFLMLSILVCFVLCQNTIDDNTQESSTTMSLEESLRENFGNLYDGLETGILMEGSLNSYWELNGDTITLFGDGAFISMAASFFPWRNVDEHITKVHIAGGVTSISSYGFYDYDNLVEVKIENGSFVGMGMGCFGGNENLKSGDLGDSLREIPTEAFIRCGSLEYISIPSTVTQIGYDAFKDCTSLQTINYSGSEADWNKIIIEEGNESLNQAQIIFNN